MPSVKVKRSSTCGVMRDLSLSLSLSIDRQIGTKYDLPALFWLERSLVDVDVLVGLLVIGSSCAGFRAAVDR